MVLCRGVIDKIVCLLVVVCGSVVECEMSDVVADEDESGCVHTGDGVELVMLGR